MINIYYTAHEGRRNANGHTRTTGEVYKIGTDENGVSCLINLGEYSHHSGGADISASVLDVCENNGIDTNGGYFKNWRDTIILIQI